MRTTDTLGNDNVTWFSPQAGLFVKQSLQRSDKHALGAGRRDSEPQRVLLQQHGH